MTARVYQEGLFVYGSKRSVEWGFIDSDAPIESELQPRTDTRWRGKPVACHTVELPNP